VTNHYEQRLQRDLDAIGDLVGSIGASVLRAVEDAVRAVLTLDKDLAAGVVVGDYSVNRGTRELDRLCHAFVARHLPSAGHLRFVSAVLRLGIALERTGDYAATVSRTVAQLSSTPPAIVARDIEMLAEHAHAVFRDALRAFLTRDLGLAQALLAAAAKFTQDFDRVFADLVREGEERTRPVADLFALMATFHRLDRVIHQAKNIGEEAVFVATGQTKGERTFRILFVDAANSGPSLLAQHYADKAYPRSGVYRSAGWEPARDVDPRHAEFARGLGLDLGAARPTDIAALRGELDGFQFVVGLDPAARERLGPLPFHTTLLIWPIEASGGPDEVYRHLCVRLRELMERLRGELAG
jgi:phosphate transport system protein